jgi:hypothetical protein
MFNISSKRHSPEHLLRRCASVIRVLTAPGRATLLKTVPPGFTTWKTICLRLQYESARRIREKNMAQF